MAGPMDNLMGGAQAPAEVPALPYPEEAPKKGLSLKKYLIGAGVVGALIIGAVATSGPSDDERFIARLVAPMKAASTSLAKRTPSRGPT